MDTTAIETIDLTRAYDNTTVVDGLDLTVDAGQIHALLGPNGSGKTTTVRMLCGLLAPTAGTARILGHDITTARDRVQASIGVALQETGLDPLATPTETLVLHGQLNGLTSADAHRRAHELLEIVDLTGVATDRVTTLSGGTRRRLDLAVALVTRPQLLFLDEPTTGLDPISRRVLWNEIRTLNADGVTVLLTTQYLEEADELADNVTIIDRGHIITHGSPTDLKATVGGDRIAIGVATTDRPAARDLLTGHLATHDFVDNPEGLTVHATDGVQRAAELVRLLADGQITVTSVLVTQATLDDVFLLAVGHHLTTAVERQVLPT